MTPLSNEEIERVRALVRQRREASGDDLSVLGLIHDYETPPLRRSHDPAEAGRDVPFTRSAPLPTSPGSASLSAAGAIVGAVHSGVSA